jgi:hypothetical protein
MIVLWFPENQDTSFVAEKIREWVANGKPLHQQVQDWVNSRFPSFNKRCTYLSNTYVPIDTMCSICFDTSSNMHSACGHFFHRRCLKQWLFKSKTCPLCRASITL